MIIVKLTVLSITITAIFALAIKIWAVDNPIEYFYAKKSEKYPVWAYGLPLFVFLDVIGILASIVYLLFFIWED